MHWEPGGRVWHPSEAGGLELPIKRTVSSTQFVMVLELELNLSLFIPRPLPLVLYRTSLIKAWEGEEGPSGGKGKEGPRGEREQKPVET